MVYLFKRCACLPEAGVSHSTQPASFVEIRGQSQKLLHQMLGTKYYRGCGGEYLAKKNGPAHTYINHVRSKPWLYKFGSKEPRNLYLHRRNTAPQPLPSRPSDRGPIPALPADPIQCPKQSSPSHTTRGVTAQYHTPLAGTAGPTPPPALRDSLFSHCLQILFDVLMNANKLFNISMLALAASPSAPVFLEDTRYQRPGVLSPAGNNTVIVDGLIFVPGPTSYFSPPYPESTAYWFGLAEQLVASFFQQKKVDWATLGTSQIVYGPPQYTNILAKVTHT